MKIKKEVEQLLRDARRLINDIDERLVFLLAKRFKVARSIGILKKELGQPISNPKREKEILERIHKEAAKNNIDPKQFERIFIQIIAESKNYENDYLSR